MTTLTKEAINSNNPRRIRARLKTVEQRLDRLVIQGENRVNSEAIRRIYLADAEEARLDIDELEFALVTKPEFSIVELNQFLENLR